MADQNFRIGFGYDVHRLAEGEDLVIGGVQIPHEKGTVAHSDGDVLIHAICDALLGAANLRDIGVHFPDHAEEWKNADSRIFLRRITELIHQKGYQVGNIDSTICLQKPRISGYIPEMKPILASCMKTIDANISIKATTTEELGFVGQQEGISAYAVVLIFSGY